MSENTSRLSAALADRYAIERELGAGGMATVYLAEDLKHERKVALKVLKPELAAVLGADRFVQEIKTTASLQHPHILPLFDSGQANGFLYYVMPYVEGETLRDKLDREAQLGIDETVRITTEVADALDYAHRNGVIHRDIKPENILLHDGRPMVADFGIALAVSAAAGGRMTETGLSLGTPHYMSPEQATAEKEITNRSDIYSLACVTYEMLAGNPPHTGSSAQQIIMKIVTEEAAAVTSVRKSVPPNVAAATAKALEKLPADRFDSASDFVQALKTPSFRHGVEGVSGAAAAPGRRSDPWVLALAAALAVMTGIAAWALLRPAPPRPVARYNIDLPEDQRIGGFFARIALTPDGSRVVYSAGTGVGTPTGLRVRQRDQLGTTSLAGTAGGYAPFVSPDGSRVGFSAGGELKVVSLRGGPPVTITDTLVGGGGATWSPDGFIYVDGQGQSPLVKVLAAGGTPEWFTRIDSANGETDHLFPVALPNGRGVLFRVAYSSAQGETDIAVAETATGN
ncbi:MAG: protein kinase, partial [Gemmatimonadota bacterium]